jgi:hypothetical protein
MKTLGQTPDGVPEGGGEVSRWGLSALVSRSTVAKALSTMPAKGVAFAG